MNQIQNSRYEVSKPENGDFMVSGITIEVGEKIKSSKQVLEAKDFMIAADEIGTGWGTKAPLWLFGFLY